MLIAPNDVESSSVSPFVIRGQVTKGQHSPLAFTELTIPPVHTVVTSEIGR